MRSCSTSRSKKPSATFKSELHFYGPLGMVVDQVERGASIFRVQGLRDHRCGLQRAAFQPPDDVRQKVPVKPGTDQREFLLHDLLLTDVAGGGREAEEADAAGRASKAVGLIQK